MHLPEGFWKDGLGDIEVIAHEGVLHAFYLCIRSHDRVGHLTSEDALVWEEQTTALHTGRPGDFDDDQIWTMGVFAFDGQFFMLYTGLSLRERGKIQRIGLATSTDLFHWEKYPANPLIEADPRFYDAYVDAKHRIDWRDPFVLEHNGILHGILSARLNHGPSNRRGAAAHVTSRDGYSWKVREPLYCPETCFDFETPALAKVKGRFYLTGIAGRNAENQPTAPSIYRVSESIDGPYRRISHGTMLPGDNQVFKPVEWKGKTLYFHNLRGVADWEGGGNAAVTSLAPPKIADADPDGALVLRPYNDWSTVANGSLVELESPNPQEDGESIHGVWTATSDAMCSSGSFGYEVFFLHGNWDHLIFEATVATGICGESGILVRSDESADEATFVTLDPISRKVELSTVSSVYKTPSAGITYRWRGRRIVQDWLCSRAWGSVVHIRAVFYGPYVEVSIDDCVALSAVSQARPSGRIGFFSEDAAMRVMSCRIESLQPSAAVASCV